AEHNPSWFGKYTVEGNKVSLDVGDSTICDPGALWVWEVKEIDGEHIKFTILEDGCPEAGSDSTGQTFTWRACTLEIPLEGLVICEPVEG
ncbi:MAG: hypothetical protein KAI94_02145, partial [Anaerolineales bacterium]|nr:hypothetical protein [Anaerolineales bacterium]